MGITTYKDAFSRHFQPGDDRIVIAAGTVDDEQLSVLIPAAYNTHMGVLRIKTPGPPVSLASVDGLTIAMLGGGFAAVGR